MKNIYIYVGLMVLASGFAFLKGLVLAKLLGTVGYGYYALALLVTTYGVYLCAAGINDGLLREIPLKLGDRKFDEVINIRNASITLVILVSVIIFLIYFVLVLAFSGNDTNNFTVLLLAYPIIFSTLLFNLILVEIRARQFNIVFALALFFRNAGIVLLSFMGINLFDWNTNNILLLESTINFAVFLLLAYKWIPNLQLKTNLALSFPVVKVGLPFTLTNFLKNATVSLDRWFVTGLFGVAILGEYTFAFVIFSGGLVILNIIGQYIGPSLIYQYGRAGQIDQTFNQIFAYSKYIILFFAAGYFPFTLLAEYVVVNFFSEYVLVVSLIKLIYVGTLFHVANMFDWVAVALGKGNWLAVVYIVVGLSVLIFCVIAYWMSYPIQTYALIFCFGRLISLLASYCLAKFLIKKEKAIAAPDFAM